MIVANGKCHFLCFAKWFMRTSKNDNVQQQAMFFATNEKVYCSLQKLFVKFPRSILCVKSCYKQPFRLRYFMPNNNQLASPKSNQTPYVQIFAWNYLGEYLKWCYMNLLKNIQNYIDRNWEKTNVNLPTLSGQFVEVFLHSTNALLAKITSEIYCKAYTSSPKS